MLMILRSGGGELQMVSPEAGWSVPADQADDITLDAVMTLAFRSPVLQVKVPAHYRPNGPAEVMADLDAVVRAHTTSTGRHCS